MASLREEEQPSLFEKEPSSKVKALGSVFGYLGLGLATAGLVKYPGSLGVSNLQPGAQEFAYAAYLVAGMLVGTVVGIMLGSAVDKIKDSFSSSAAADSDDDPSNHIPRDGTGSINSIW